MPRQMPKWFERLYSIVNTLLGIAVITFAIAWIWSSDQRAQCEAFAKSLSGAALRGDTDAVTTFIASGFDVNTPTEHGITALHYAASHGHSDIILLLIKAGAHLEPRDYLWGHTPLHSAARYGETEAAITLLEAGADIHALNFWGQTPFLRALQYARADTALTLLDQGSHEDVTDIFGNNAIHYMQDILNIVTDIEQ